MPSAVDICNIALSHIGADAVVTSISPPDGSAESGHCARFYPIARKLLIEMHRWQFAKSRAQLAEVTNTSDIWQFAYALPADCINPLRVLQLKFVTAAGFVWPSYHVQYNWGLVDNIFSERGSSDFEIEGNVLRTNEPEAVLLYTRDVTDTTKFTNGFVDALGMLVASYVAGPIIKGTEGANVGARLRQTALQLAEMAAAVEGNRSSESSDHVPAHIISRL